LLPVDRHRPAQEAGSVRSTQQILHRLDGPQ
jgi:hypothetical protein